MLFNFCVKTSSSTEESSDSASIFFNIFCRSSAHHTNQKRSPSSVERILSEILSGTNSFLLLPVPSFMLSHTGSYSSKLYPIKDSNSSLQGYFFFHSHRFLIHAKCRRRHVFIFGSANWYVDHTGWFI